MYGKAYRSKGGRTLYRPVLESEDEMDGVTGWCLGCGQEAHGVEPDAREYKCEGCGESLVYGIEELLLMGLARLKGGGK